MTEPHDPIEQYLDEVCKLLPFTQSDETMAERWKSTYGIEVSNDVVSALPEKFQILIAESRSEGKMLRAELRSHIDAAVARFEVDGVDHYTAVRQAIKEFGSAKRLNRLLRKEFRGTVEERVRRALVDHEKNTSKARTRINAFVQYGIISLMTWVVLTAKEHGRTLETAIPWITAILPSCLVLGFLRTHSTSKNTITANRMRSLFSSPDAQGSTLKQRAMRSFARSLFANIAERHSPSIPKVVRSLCIRLAVLTFFWFGPIAGDLKFELFYYGLALFGFWVGEIIAAVIDNQEAKASSA